MEAMSASVFGDVLERCDLLWKTEWGRERLHMRYSRICKVARARVTVTKLYRRIYPPVENQPKLSHSSSFSFVSPPST